MSTFEYFGDPKSATVVEAAAQENGNKILGGFIPVSVEDGKVCGNTWSNRPSEVFHDVDQCLEVAYQRALHRIDNHIGDAVLTIRAEPIPYRRIQ